MRARIRQLKPDVFFDEELWALIDAHPDLHLLQAFEGLWCQADREGRFEWRPAMLKSQILPYWGGDFERPLEMLRRAGFIVRYEVGGRAYGLVRSFHRHQRPNNREPESTLPPPLEHAEASLEQTEAGELEHSEAGASSVREPAGFSPARVPTPNPNPYSQPQFGSGSRVARDGPKSDPNAAVGRTYSLPSEQPPQPYLDEAAMAGVSREQATSTWEHYFGAGLPPGGIERPHRWLIKRAKDRANHTARAGPQRAGPRGSSDVFAYALHRISEEESKERAGT